MSEEDLKLWLHQEINVLDKNLLILSTFKSPCSPSDIKNSALKLGLPSAKKWNPSSTLGRSKGLAIRVSDGWEITESGKQHLRNIGVTKLSAAAVQVASDLRALLDQIVNPDVKCYVEEAIRRHEAELFKSAIVMSWLAAIAVLHTYTVQNHLVAFNIEAARIDSKWKQATNADDLGEMPEFKFLERLHGISVLNKNRKEELQKALKLRNGCGHPNSLIVGPNMVAAHIESLLLNVFNVFEV